MIYFRTPTALPIEAATTMGVSVKDSPDAIGKFGTGLKYAIAGVLRLGGNITITVDGDRHQFTSRERDLRGRSFRIVHCNDEPCGFTTELGKHWEPWQLFRELASNTLDEGGNWGIDARPSRTVVAVACREVEQAGTAEAVFLDTSRRCLLRSAMGAEVYEGASQHYYYNGIRAGSFAGVAPVTVNVTDGDLSEDRLLDLAKVRTELSWALRTATHWDEQLLLSILPQSEPGEFWVDNLEPWTLKHGDMPESILQFMADRSKFVTHPAMKSAMERHLRKGGAARYAEVPATARTDHMLRMGEDTCRAVGIDPIPRERAKFTSDLPDKTLAVTCMDTREVWFSTKLAMLGRDEFLCGYVEEALHAMTGLSDCTREFQNALLSIVVATATGETRAAA